VTTVKVKARMGGMDLRRVALELAVECCKNRPAALDSSTVLEVAEEFRRYMDDGSANGG
jgi:hypothetical protein